MTYNAICNNDDNNGDEHVSKSEPLKAGAAQSMRRSLPTLQTVEVHRSVTLVRSPVYTRSRGLEVASPGTRRTPMLEYLPTLGAPYPYSSRYSSYQRTPTADPDDQRSRDSSTGANDQNALPYSAFTTSRKRVIVTLVSVAGLFSQLTSLTFFPTLPTISKDLHIEPELLNLTITFYLVIQGVTPLLLADIAENYGRRPVYLASFLIYTIASIALGFQSTFAGLVTLRCIQSFGVSGTIALAYGVINDIATESEKCGYIGMAHVGFYGLAMIGPVLSGGIVMQAGFRWVFWVLGIFGFAVLLAFGIWMPETGRKVAGDGSTTLEGIYISFWDFFARWRLCATERQDSRPSLTGNQRQQAPSFFKVWNPFRSLVLLLQKTAALVLAVNGVFYLQYTVTQASLASLLQERYGLTPLLSGVCYLTYGLSGTLASLVIGRILDRDFDIVAKAHGFSIEKEQIAELDEFPIERARLRSIWWYICIAAGATIVYGWAIQFKINLAVPLITQVMTGLTTTGVFNVVNALMTDLHRDQSMNASAVVSVTKCASAALGVSVMQLLFNAIGVGWTFTIIGALCYLTVIPLLVVRQLGWRWRVPSEYNRTRKF